MRKSETEIIDNRDRVIGKTLSKWRKRASAKTVADTEIRITEYFDFIEQNGVVPNLGQLALCLGISRKSLYNHRCGLHCSAEMAMMIDRACQQIDAVRQIGADSGTIPWAYEIWYQKSRNGFSDQLHESEAERMIRSINIYQKFLIM